MVVAIIQASNDNSLINRNRTSSEKQVDTAYNLKVKNLQVNENGLREQE